MKLIVQKFELLDKTLKQVSETKNDVLGDVVVAIELGFVNRDSIQSHTFCFHYLIDKYEGKSNISFMILDANQQTGQYCFWEYKDYSYKENIRQKKIKIENTLIKIPKAKIHFEFEGQPIEKVVELIKEDLWDSHLKILKKFKDGNIEYDESMELFSKELKEYINLSYKDLFSLDLAHNIKQYEMENLDRKLDNRKKDTKKLKI